MRVQEEIKVVADGIFEAEYVDISKWNTGWGAPIYEYPIIENLNASNGHYLGWLNESKTVDFVISSIQAVSNADLFISLGAEFDGVFTPKEFAIYVNGAEIDYGSFSAKHERETGAPIFNECTVVADGLTLNAGENIIRFEVKPNTLWGDRCGGPCIDYIRIDNFGDATLSWRPYTYNLDWLELD